MKIIKRILCVFCCFLIIFAFSACDKTNMTETKNESNLEQQQPQESQPEESDDEQSEQEESIVPLTASDILLAGANLSNSFLSNYSFDLEDENDFDDFVYDNKILFLNATKILTKLASFEKLTYGRCSKGVELTLDDYTGKPSNVNKLLANFSEETAASNGESSVELSIIFGYHNLNDSYTYDFYYFKIVTNRITNDISYECDIEKSAVFETTNSTATFYTFDYAGKFGENSSVDTYNFYQFHRIKKITDASTNININYIDEFERSSYDGENYVYFDPANSTMTLINPNASEISLIRGKVDTVLGKFNPLHSSGTGRATVGLSDLIVPYDNGTSEIG